MVSLDTTTCLHIGFGRLNILSVLELSLLRVQVIVTMHNHCFFVSSISENECDMYTTCTFY